MAEDISQSIIRIISSFAEDINADIARALPAIGDEAIAELKETSPKDTGEYSRSWKKHVTSNRKGTSVIVSNSKYQLTHLLENGTLNADGTQRTKEYPHISPANENAQRKLTELLGGD